MTRESDDALEPAGTFVVQLRAGSDVARKRISGRVEHVMSGQSERFASLADLLSFMARRGTPTAPAGLTNPTRRRGHRR
jgi:hypothetical protein